MTNATESDTVYDLLTMPIDKDVEAYLKKQGLSWFFARRRKFQRFMTGATDKRAA
ncbi:hypothetical protein ACFL6S_20735 [Candidatus Poribacteria bacterium]